MRRVWAVVVVAVVAHAGAIRAQGAIRGHVVSAESGAPLPYAVVMLMPGYQRMFAGEEGDFGLAALDSGTYRIFVRQIGYRPFDSTLTVAAGPTSVRIVLHQVPLILPAVQVASAWRCENPGPPDPKLNPAFAELFDRVRDAATHVQALANEYPYRYAVARVVSQAFDDGHIEIADRDTVAFNSADHPRNAAQQGEGSGNGLPDAQLVRLPGLADLADSAFEQRHCFRYGGVDTVNARERIRIDFRTDSRRRAADFNGEAWLEPGTYELRELHIEMVHADRVLDGVAGLSATIIFREVLPWVVVVDHLHAATEFIQGQGTLLRQSVEQRLIAMDFGIPISLR